MTADARRREDIVELFLVSGEQRWSERRSTSWLRISTAGPLIVVGLLWAMEATAQPASKFAKLTPQQVHTLLALAHDYHPRAGTTTSPGGRARHLRAQTRMDEEPQSREETGHEEGNES